MGLKYGSATRWTSSKTACGSNGDWGEEITVPAPIFVVANHTGGQVIGAFDGGKLVGMTLALAGFRGRRDFCIRI